MGVCQAEKKRVGRWARLTGAEMRGTGEAVQTLEEALMPGLGGADREEPSVRSLLPSGASRGAGLPHPCLEKQPEPLQLFHEIAGVGEGHTHSIHPTEEPSFSASFPHL